MKRRQWFLVSVVMSIFILPALAFSAPPHRLKEAHSAQTQEIPETLLPTLIASMEANMPEAYHAKKTAGLGCVAKNEAQKLAFGFSTKGIEISSGTKDSWQMRLNAFGFDAHVSKIKSVTPEAKGARIEYTRDGLTEWYINSPYGMEQGFTIEAPKEKETKKLTLSFTLDGEGEIRQNGNDLILTSKGKPTINYKGLHAYNAEGRVLVSNLSLKDNNISIDVDVSVAVYPIVVDPLFTQETKLLASDGMAGDNFGRSVAIDGYTAIIGASSYDAAYVFTISDGLWTEEQIIFPSDGTPAKESFGYSVDLDGDTAVVGAFMDSTNAISAGAAYVFVRTSGVWTQEQKLLPADGASRDYFGISVGVSGDTVIVSAREDDDKGSGAGSAYVFERSQGLWTMQKKLLASDGNSNDSFGYDVAISGDIIIIGAIGDSDKGSSAGAAYIFKKEIGVWTEKQKLFSSDISANDFFGISVAVDADTAVVGVTQDDDNGSHSGSAYVFIQRISGFWSEEQKLTASDAAQDDDFGNDVAVSGDTVIVGAYHEDFYGQDSGSAYLFVRNAGAWRQQEKLTPSDPTTYDYFGISVSVSGDIAIVGSSYDDDNGDKSGSAYIFEPPPMALADIKANGSDDPITLSSSETLILSIALDSRKLIGMNADWWLIAYTPVGTYHYNAKLDRWVSGQNVTYQGPLFDLATREVLNMSGLPTGNYYISFKVDTNMNGVQNASYSDSVSVTIVP